MEFLLEYANSVGPFFVAVIILVVVLKDKRKKDTPADLTELLGEIKDIKDDISEIKTSQLATVSTHKDVQSVVYMNKNFISSLHEILILKDDDGTYRWWNKPSVEKQITETHTMVKQIKGGE